ncbi:hypothetical protein KY290_037548 [Solanum tuberosum]|uniref:Uncharacterized protein n=1 Tax=Solanum tuberosum TaxID=4113 RepID=A0ABQ7TXR9_SOLTU|nr:hypothetical protein KY284_036900 [Solanum tuberosum]KAH0738843.1 hypothetical protein KY290_037548 [Solanum tuberosum]
MSRLCEFQEMKPYFCVFRRLLVISQPLLLRFPATTCDISATSSAFSGDCLRCLGQPTASPPTRFGNFPEYKGKKLKL